MSNENEVVIHCPSDWGTQFISEATKSVDIDGSVRYEIGEISRFRIVILHEQDFTGVEDRIISMARSAKSNMALAMCHSMMEAEIIEFKHRDYEPLPKPTKQKLFIKEPKRQSFRQSMRSVNRNR